LTLSEQVAARHLKSVPQTELTQSPFVVQTRPALHFGQVDPPQSTSVSLPFMTPSEHDAAVQTLFVHRLLVQSAFALHAWPLGHFGQLPPQSTADSEPFFTLSVQFGAWHSPDVQTPLEQSPAKVQIFCAAHPGQVPPPQST